jgi:hypothetical protein
MNRSLKLLSAAALSIGLLAAGAAHAHGHGGPRFGVDFVFGPWWWAPPAYYYPPGYYYPPVVAAPDPVYSASSTAQMPAPAAYWYFCPQSNTYYPYVSECPGGWQQVTPTPPPPPAPAAPGH